MDNPETPTRGEPRCSGRVSGSRFLLDTRRVTHIVKSGKSFVGDRGMKQIYVKWKRFIVIREIFPFQFL